MTFKSIREEHFQEVASTFKLLSSPTKLKLLNFISFCPRTVEDCAKKLNQSVQNVSLHLIALSKAGLLNVEQVKNYRYYSLSSNLITAFVFDMLEADRKTLLSEKQSYSEPVATLIKNVKKQKSILIDLRDFEERNYLPAGIAIPFSDDLSALKNFLKQYSEFRGEIVFLCKGRMCERLAGAVKIAEESHFQAKGLALSANELKVNGAFLN